MVTGAILIQNGAGFFLSHVAPYKIIGIQDDLISLENPIMPREHYKVLSNPEDHMEGDFLV
jgi:hypothetical protein